MSRAQRKHGPRAPSAEELAYIGGEVEQPGPPRDIPGGKPHLANPVTVHQRVPAPERPPLIRGIMAHGVEPEQHGGSYDREEKHPPRPPDRPAALVARPSPVPVYIVEAGGGSRPLLRSSGRHYTAPPIGSEPIEICGEDHARRSVLVLNEGTPVALNSVNANGSVANPAAGAVLCSATLAPGMWLINWTAQLTAGGTAQADLNDFLLRFTPAGGSAVTIAQSVNMNAVGQYPQPQVTYTTPYPGTLAVTAGSASASSTYSASFTATPQAVGGAVKGIRVGALAELAFDAANNAIIGGILLPNAMTGYERIYTQAPLYAVSADAFPPMISVILESEISGAG
jgi:hypothetical protein